ncbi:MAG: DUF5615 family PIN-like protein [Rhodospirillales bacterium]|nr:MAG: DUF5615 family PIN-like protein [Rhodospirillales bacterium]
MTFLIDNQLPVALARWIAARGVDAVHVLDAGMGGADDRDIWATAVAQGRIVVSKDEDFFHLASRPGDAGRLLWVRVGNTRRVALLARFDAAWRAITSAFEDGQRIVELR